MGTETKQNGTFGTSAGSAINYGIQSKDGKMRMKTCKGTGKKLPITEFYFDLSNNRYESYCKEWKMKISTENRTKDECSQLKQRCYNYKSVNRQLRERIKQLENDKSRS